MKMLYCSVGFLVFHLSKCNENSCKIIQLSKIQKGIFFESYYLMSRVLETASANKIMVYTEHLKYVIDALGTNERRM